uniref:Uncharacterized protein n=1 Tax=Anguilla anguilla TaxID=7936 RepID=A0A0E9RQG3_ANGAN
MGVPPFATPTFSTRSLRTSLISGSGRFRDCID